MTYRSQQRTALPALPQHPRSVNSFLENEEPSTVPFLASIKQNWKKNPSDSVNDNATVEVTQLYQIPDICLKDWWFERFYNKSRWGILTHYKQRQTHLLTKKCKGPEWCYPTAWLHFILISKYLLHFVSVASIQVLLHNLGSNNLIWCLDFILICMTFP